MSMRRSRSYGGLFGFDRSQHVPGAFRTCHRVFAVFQPTGLRRQVVKVVSGGGDLVIVHVPLLTTSTCHAYITVPIWLMHKLNCRVVKIYVVRRITCLPPLQSIRRRIMVTRFRTVRSNQARHAIPPPLVTRFWVFHARVCFARCAACSSSILSHFGNWRFAV